MGQHTNRDANPDPINFTQSRWNLLLGTEAGIVSRMQSRSRIAVPDLYGKFISGAGAGTFSPEPELLEYFALNLSQFVRLRNLHSLVNVCQNLSRSDSDHVSARSVRTIVSQYRDAIVHRPARVSNGKTDKHTTHNDGFECAPTCMHYKSYADKCGLVILKSTRKHNSYLLVKQVFTVVKVEKEVRM